MHDAEGKKGGRTIEKGVEHGRTKAVIEAGDTFLREDAHG